VEGNCFWCRRREWRWVYSNSVCSLSFFLFSCGLCFCVCALVRCTPQFGSAYSFNPFLFILISAIDIAPLICHSPSHAQPSHAHCHIHASPTLFLSFFLARICFSSCMAQAKPRAPYAIYALAFNVSHPKSLSIVRLPINCSHSRIQATEYVRICTYEWAKQTTQIRLWS